jgi:hypothetical protein
VGSAEANGLRSLWDVDHGARYSPKGVKTAKLDVDMVERRLKAAQQDYEARYGKEKR